MQNRQNLTHQSLRRHLVGEEDDDHGSSWHCKALGDPQENLYQTCQYPVLYLEYFWTFPILLHWQHCREVLITEK
jgi:hypothetical protein